jgi:hypothetical protein
LTVEYCTGFGSAVVKNPDASLKNDWMILLAGFSVDAYVTYWKTTLKLEQKVAFVPGAESESWP